VSDAYDVLVVGAGPAGMTAAMSAARHGLGVLLLDDNPAAGGQIWRGEQNTAIKSVESVPRSFGTRAVGLTRPGVLLAEQNGFPLELPFRKLVLATGARERFLPFPGWTLPGVVGAGGLQAFVKSGLPIDGKTVVVAGTGPLLGEVASFLMSKGARVPVVLEQASLRALLRLVAALRHAPGKLSDALGILGHVGKVLRGNSWVVEAHGDGKLEAVTIRSGARTLRVPCDYLACGFHIVPNTELAAVLGCRLDDDYVATDSIQQTSVPGIYCAGETCGIGGVGKALVEGEIAGHAVAGDAASARRLFKRRDRARRFEAALELATRLRPELGQLARPDTIVCRCEDVRLRDLAVFRDWRSAKVQTRCGMGPCQGRVCGPAVEALFGCRNESVRPPCLPVKVRTLAAGG